MTAYCNAWRQQLAALAATLMVVSLAGCYQAPQPAAPTTTTTTTAAAPAETAKDLAPGDILKRMLERYRQAKTYRDRGEIRLDFVERGQPQHLTWPCSVAFERPNKLALSAFQATVVCDGKQFWARIEDEPSGNVDHQIVERPAPEQLKLTDLAADALLYSVISSQLQRQPIQLELLLESGGLVAAFGEGVACKALEPAKSGDRECHRIEVPSPGGAFVFWVDSQDFVLRRLDYPAAALVPDLTNNPEVKEVALFAVLSDAQLDTPLAASAFAFTVSEGAKRMRTFVVPPQPLPSELFGRQPSEFYFTDLGGKKVADEDLLGKTTVLVWYHDHPACEATLQQVSAAHERLKDEPVAMYAVATDPTTASHADLAQRLESWKVHLPILRDLEAFGDKAFKIAVQPTLVVLDAKGRVQVFQPGGNPQLADQVVQIVQRLKQGDNLAAEVVARQEREQKDYAAQVARGGPEPSEVLELPEAVLRPRSEPKLLKLTKLWSTSEIAAPGNIVLVEEPGQETRIFVLEGWRKIAELSAEGQVRARHDLAIPEPAAITFARAGIAADGKRLYAASAPLAPQVYLFDADWKLVATMPAEGQPPLQATDVAFADVGKNAGEIGLLVGSVGGAGLAAMSLDGSLIWRAKAFPNVGSVAVSRPNDVGSWGIYATGETGTVLRVNRYGQEDPPKTVGNWPAVRLVSARFSAAKQAAFLCLSNNERGELFAVGVTADLAEAWNYPLPSGVHRKPIEPITSSHIFPGRQGEWWLAGPDGSVHVVSEDGEVHDSFFYGEALTGIAAAELDGKSVLLLATDAGLTAWEVRLPAVRER